MLYINFVVITDTSLRLMNFLIAAGILQEIETAEGTHLVGARPGMEWVMVPNPRVTDPGSGIPDEPGYVPPTYDTRNVYLIKFAHESLANEIDGATHDEDGNPIDIYDWSKFGKRINATGAWQDAPAGWTINGVLAGRTWKITNQNIWLVREAPERFGYWQ